MATESSRAEEALPEGPRREGDKDESRGRSIDMSPEALSRRLDILVELDELARALERAKYLGKTSSVRAR